MHIPDGFLDAKTALTGAVLAVAGVGLAVRSVRQTMAPSRIPLLGMTSAFVFAAQMINFPVAAGTSGHLIGAVLAAVLLGPGAAVVVLASVLVLQCFLFQDGGVTALGVNVFNLAILAPVSGYAVYALVLRVAGVGLRSRLLATAFAAWCSTLVAAVACAGQLALSGTVAWSAALPAMAGIHALIGAGEALITTLVVAAILRLRPEFVLNNEAGFPRARQRALVWQGLLVALGLVLFVAPFASGWPDGLESVAAGLGFEQRAAASPVLAAPWPDYTLPGLTSPGWSTVLAGLLGTWAAFLLSWVLAGVLTRSDLREGRRTGGLGE